MRIIFAGGGICAILPFSKKCIVPPRIGISAIHTLFKLRVLSGSIDWVGFWLENNNYVSIYLLSSCINSDI